MRLPLWVGLAGAAAAAAGCAARPMPEEGGRDAADVAAEAARLAATPLAKPVLPPLVVPPHAVSAVAEQTLPAEPAVAFVARRPTARSLRSALAAATAELLADPAVRAAVAGPVVVVYRRPPTPDLDRSFDVEVGVVVRPGTAPRTPGVAVRPLPPLSAVAVTFTGPPAAIDRAYDKLVPAVQAGPWRPTGEVREVYRARRPAAPATGPATAAVTTEADGRGSGDDAAGGAGEAGGAEGPAEVVGPTSPHAEVTVAVGVGR